MLREYNFDGLVGPTHHYAGLSYGNVASLKHSQQVARPREAALQGLAKARFLWEKGLGQSFLLPHARPSLGLLRQLGFDHNDETAAYEKCFKYSPKLFSALCSASAMWTANAATVSPSTDSGSSKLQFSVANLANKFHRFIEASFTESLLKKVFAASEYFEVHSALPPHPWYGDEGAANHTRLHHSQNSENGLEIFCFGQKVFDEGSQKPVKFPARHSLEASQAVSRRHKLSEKNVIFVQQNPAVIDQGVFHNDVIAVGNAHCLFFHEDAFLGKEKFLSDVKRFFGDESPYFLIEVPSESVSVQDAVSSYLFNSQLLSVGPAEDPHQKMLLLLPEECRENERVHSYLQGLVGDASTPIQDLEFFDLRQSMCNGGGPACLRLRVAMTEKEEKNLHAHFLLNEERFTKIEHLIKRYYREELKIEDMIDPQFHRECESAFDELTQIFSLGSLYDFQK